MKPTFLVLASLAMFALGGCKHVSGSGTVASKSGSISVSSGKSTSSKSSGGKFCPPGQAKKGRC